MPGRGAQPAGGCGARRIPGPFAPAESRAETEGNDMTEQLLLLSATAATLGVVHTAIGPDHYVPFIAMSRAGGWSMRKTMMVTVLCGVGHVLSSVAIGMVGIAFGVAVLRLESIEAARGDLAGWLLLGFGAAYMVWGIRRAVRDRPHTHAHVHADGTVHAHEHTHAAEHLHVHDHARNAEGAGGKRSLTPWVLFTIFLFGPCEPLIPLLMYPAAQGRFVDVVIVSFLFAVATIGTMSVIVFGVCFGAERIPSRLRASLVRSGGGMQRYVHAIAGCVVLVCGLAIKAGL